MAHPLEAIIREAYAAFGRGDLDGYLRPCTEDFTFNVPGRGAIAGTYRGNTTRTANEFSFINPHVY